MTLWLDVKRNVKITLKWLSWDYNKRVINRKQWGIIYNVVAVWRPLPKLRTVFVTIVKVLNPRVISKVAWVWSSGWSLSWIGLLLLTVIFRVKVSRITSVYHTLVIGLIGQLRCDVIGRLSVKPWCYWLWRLVISNWCVSIRLLSQLNSRLLLVKLSVLQSFSRS